MLYRRNFEYGNKLLSWKIWARLKERPPEVYHHTGVWCWEWVGKEKAPLAKILVKLSDVGEDASRTCTTPNCCNPQHFYPTRLTRIKNRAKVVDSGSKP